MKLLDDYESSKKALFDFFGYVEDWVAIPIDDARKYFWRLEGEGPGEVQFADTEQELAEESGNYYVNEIYTQRFLPKWVYRAEGYTMVCVDTHTDGNKFLQIFDNAKERPNNGLVGKDRFTIWDGQYDKTWYDVLLPDGSVVERCWPNAGKMVATDGSGREWEPGPIAVRVSPNKD